MCYRKNIVGLLIFLLSVFISLVLVEVVLRIYFVKYKYAAESQYSTSPYRIFARSPNSVGRVSHPDTNKMHLYITNELGQHQHRRRDLSLLNDDNVIKIGVFGDSFTENMRVESQYSFVEVLDYLLNCNKMKFEVYNFGVEGYGTDQSFLYYRDSPVARKLNYVLYTFCSNDVRNNFENNLFSIDLEGNLVPLGPHKQSFIKLIISRLYLTYFIEEVYYRLSTKYNFTIDGMLALLRGENKKAYYAKNVYTDVRGQSGLQMERDLVAGTVTKSTKYAEKLFNSILNSWKKLVKFRGGEFVVVTLPRPSEYKLRRIFDKEKDVVSLWSLFYGNVECPNAGTDCQQLYTPWRFANNDHWNEAGNLKAAILLYKYLTERMNIAAYDEKWLNERLVDYYSAFPKGWQPYYTSLVHPLNVSSNHTAGIREKYNELDNEYAK